MNDIPESDVLHITNGDHAAQRIGATGIAGLVLPWRDVLHEGPVPGGLSLQELSAVRARFIADQGWDDYDEVLRNFASRDDTLAESARHEEVVLWFEHDLYDQLQLIQLLDWYSEVAPRLTTLTLICVPEYLGATASQRLSELFKLRQPVSELQLAQGRSAWKAFRSPDPAVVSSLLDGDTSALPYLAGALHRHLEEFPGVGSGLSRSERQILEAIADGVPNLKEAFYAAHHRQEDPVFLGDLTFASYLERLSRGTDPLITLTDGRAIMAPRTDETTGGFWAQAARLTPIGRAVLKGERDWLAIQEIDRWLGGVQLRPGKPIWRWNPARQRLEADDR